MNRTWLQAHGFKTTDHCHQCGYRVPESKGYFATKSLLAGLLGTATLSLPIVGHTQSLDDAVNAQLKFSGGIECQRLLDGIPGNTSFLNGELLNICSRGAPQGGSPSSFSTGGGATTPTTLPSIVQQRLREARGKENISKTKVSAASADAAVVGGKRRGFFISAEYEALDREVTTFEDGYDSDIQRLVVGWDFQTTARWAAGFAFDAAQQEGDFKGGGDFEVKSYGLVAFGSFLPTDKTFVQFYGSFVSSSYERNRMGTFTEKNTNGTLNYPKAPVSGSQSTDYDADQFRVGMLAGYDFPIRHVTISPFVGVDWQRTDFDTHSETGITGLELTFYDDEQTSLQSSVGAQASVALRSGSWAVMPQTSFIWKHEFEDDQRDVEVSFVGDTRAKRFTYQTEKPDRNWGEINVGVIAVSPGGLQVFGNYRTLTEHSFFDSDAVTIGLRVPF